MSNRLHLNIEPINATFGKIALTLETDSKSIPLLFFRSEYNKVLKWFKENIDKMLTQEPPLCNDQKTLAEWNTNVKVKSGYYDEIRLYRSSHNIRFAARGARIPSIMIGINNGQGEVSCDLDNDNSDYGLEGFTGKYLDGSWIFQFDKDDFESHILSLDAETIYQQHLTTVSTQKMEKVRRNTQTTNKLRLNIESSDGKFDRNTLILETDSELILLLSFKWFSGKTLKWFERYIGDMVTQEPPLSDGQRSLAEWNSGLPNDIDDVDLAYEVLAYQASHNIDAVTGGNNIPSVMIGINNGQGEVSCDPNNDNSDYESKGLLEDYLDGSWGYSFDVNDFESHIKSLLV